MESKLIDGHIIYTDLLTEGGWILDAGCRHFKLELKLDGNYKFMCLDPDDGVREKVNCLQMLLDSEITFTDMALMSYGGMTKYCGWSTGEGNYCYKGEPPHYAETINNVQCTTIAEIMQLYDIKQFELIKLDIEGSEYDVLLSINTPVAKQIAVEFHQSLGHNPYGSHEDYINKLMSSDFGKIYKIADWYEYETIKGIYEYNFQPK